MTKLPDFIVMGAPKCGTSAAYHYLSQHPDVFIPKAKEQHFFCTDLQTQKPIGFREYQGSFAGYKDEKRIGDVAVLYMYSKTAIHEIKKLLGDIQVVCLLRNPVEAIYAMHSQMAWGDQEDEPDFRKALDLESERKQGRHLPRNLYQHPDLLQYRATFRFGDQLERILNVLPRENVHLIFQEDLKANTEKQIRELFRFLDIDANVPIEFNVVNASKKIRFPLLQKIFFDKASPIRKAGSVILNNRNLKRTVVNFIRESNSIKAKRNPLPRDLKIELCEYYRSDVEKLESICHRNLDHWKTIDIGNEDLYVKSLNGHTS